eukprot:1138782-Pelagomonas_calceolata.AAC.1
MQPFVKLVRLTGLECACLSCKLCPENKHLSIAIQCSHLILTRLCSLAPVFRVSFDMKTSTKSTPEMPGHNCAFS